MGKLLYVQGTPSLPTAEETSSLAAPEAPRSGAWVTAAWTQPVVASVVFTRTAFDVAQVEAPPVRPWTPETWTRPGTPYVALPSPAPTEGISFPDVLLPRPWEPEAWRQPRVTTVELGYVPTTGITVPTALIPVLWPAPPWFHTPGRWSPLRLVPAIPPPPPLEHGVQALGSARYTPGMRFRGKTLVSRFKKRRNE
jgi:hypothetical protein